MREIEDKQLVNEAYQVMYRFNKEKMMIFLNQTPNKILLHRFLTILITFINNHSVNYSEEDIDHEAILEMK